MAGQCSGVADHSVQILTKGDVAFIPREAIQQLALDHPNYELPMTQEQIGDSVGLTAVHVNRSLQHLESEDLIRRNKRSVWIENWQKLADAGDFDATYLHLNRGETTPA